MTTPQIKALSEILVETGLCETQRKATNAIKRGDVYVGSDPDWLRVANPDALLVITGPIAIRVSERACYVGTPDSEDNRRRESFGSTSLEASVRV